MLADVIPQTTFSSQNPFALLSLIAAPAVLTNATSVLALSTSNRFLRASERLRALAKQLKEAKEPEERDWLLVQISRIKVQAVWLLSAMRSAYVSLGSFVSASLISIVGAGLASLQLHPWDEFLIILALAVGFLGAGGIVWACVNLFRATQLAMKTMDEEASRVTARELNRQVDLPD